MENKEKVRNVFIIVAVIIAVVAVGTFAWLTYRTRESYLSLTIGTNDGTLVTLSPYKLEGSLDPVNNYSSSHNVINVSAKNNDVFSENITIYYDISSMDSELMSTALKYTVTKSTDNGSNYSVVSSGNFSSLSSTDPTTINNNKVNNNPSLLDSNFNDNVSLLSTITSKFLTLHHETVPAKTTYKYKVYIWLDGTVGNQSTLSGKVINASMKATLDGQDFATDDWETIVSNVEAATVNRRVPYNVGDTKSISLTGFGNHTIRVANNTTPSECYDIGFSQSACGFVIEFADIINLHQMNTINTNVGGWPASAMYSYLNTDIYNALPTEVKNSIIKTKVVSGHGSNDTDNFISTDKIYLLSGKEVFNSNSYDSSAYLTRQLDYYNSVGVSSTSNGYTIKNRNGTASFWWLRDASSSNNSIFSSSSSIGSLGEANASNSNGVAPAFRIGRPKSFATDEWNTIVANIDSSVYQVGDTREISLTGFTNAESGSNGKYTIRLANKSNPDVCNTSGFSQTACGYVIEFVDVITTHKFNDTSINTGGWPGSSLYQYVATNTSTIYAALPRDIRNSIATTYVVSGHGSGESNNFVSYDKLYLLSSKEIWNNSSNDSAASLSRQLDYYSTNGVTTSSYAKVIKKFDGTAKLWWTRAAYSSSTSNIIDATTTGSLGNASSTTAGGIAPAFRIEP